MLKNLSSNKKIYLFFLILLLAGCTTYYTQTIQLNNHVATGNFQAADLWLNNDTKGKDGKNKLLHYFSRGYVSWMLNQYDKSNSFFKTAEIIIEDQYKNYGLEALALITNPNVKPYKPEDFEVVMVNYYMAMNYIQLKKYDDALVECKRINLKLNQLNDKYKDHKNRYQRDAFAATLMGLIYEADNDYNNAFIAYRNALDIYETDYQKNFGITIPTQLKRDLMRSAYLTGFYDEVRFYEEKFGVKYEHKNNENGELVFFWLNGYGPVKAEWSINFAQMKGNKQGYLTLVNEENDLSFPLYIGNRSKKDQAALRDLRFMRVAFPKYVERKPIYFSANIVANNKPYNLEIAENINEIAFKTLQDRMMREMSNALLRLAVKKALEKAAESSTEDKDLGRALGMIVNIANTATEKADTRNWQTLPYSISYARIPLNEGENSIALNTKNKYGVKTQMFKIEGVKGKTQFQSFHSISSEKANIAY